MGDLIFNAPKRKLSELSMVERNRNAKDRLTAKVDINKVNQWLTRNPVPVDWQGTPYEYAETEMMIW